MTLFRYKRLKRLFFLCAVAVSTHPACAGLGDPLSAFGAKRADEYICHAYTPARLAQRISWTTGRTKATPQE